MLNRPIFPSDYWSLAKAAIENGKFLNGPVFFIDARIASLKKLNSEEVNDKIKIFERLNEHGRNKFDLKLRKSILKFTYYHRISCTLVMSDRFTYITGKKDLLEEINKDVYGILEVPCVEQVSEEKRAKILSCNYFTQIALNGVAASLMKVPINHYDSIKGAENCIPFLFEKLLNGICDGKYLRINYPRLIGKPYKSKFRKELQDTIITIAVPEIVLDNAEKDYLWHYQYTNKPSLTQSFAAAEMSA